MSLRTNNPDKNVTKVSAFVEFYSDRAITHASFLVASILSLMILLSILPQLNDVSRWLSTFFFFGFSYLGYFILLRFKFYTDISHRLMILLQPNTIILSNDETRKLSFSEYQENQATFQKKILLPRQLMRNLTRKEAYLVIGGCYWAAVFALGTIVYSRYLDEGQWALLFGILGLICVILPPLYHDYINRNLLVAQNRRFCRYCGTEQTIKAGFCTNCGKQLT